MLRSGDRTAYLHLNCRDWHPGSSAWVRSGFRGRPEITVGFAAVIVEPDCVRLEAGDRHEVVLAHARSGASVAVGTCLRHLLAVLSATPKLDPGTLVSAMFNHQTTSTHFEGIDRVPFGASAVFDGIGPIRLTEPQRRAADPPLPADMEVAVMRAAMRDAVTDGITRASPAVAMSGGLDSAVVAAIAASAGGGRMLAVSHVPRFPGTRRRPGWVEDERSDILRVGQHVPGLDLRIVASPAETMLNHLPDAFERTCSPILNPSALTWMRSLSGASTAAGADSLLVGQAGNVTFSRGRTSQRRRSDQIRSMMARRLLSHIPTRRRNQPNLWMRAGLRAQWVPEVPVRPTGHAEAIRGYARFGSPLPFSRLAYTSGLPVSDPLSDPRVVRAALAMSNEAWTRDGYDRSLARRCGVGLLPDRVRLRIEKGAQGADQWVFRADARPDFLAAVDRVASSTGAREVVDVDRLRRSIDGWPNLSAHAHAAWDATGGRILGLGLFIAWWEAEASRLVGSGATGSRATVERPTGPLVRRP